MSQVRKYILAGKKIGVSCEISFTIINSRDFLSFKISFDKVLKQDVFSYTRIYPKLLLCLNATFVPFHRETNRETTLF